MKYHGAVRHYNYSLDRQYSVDSHQKLPADQIQLTQNKRLRNEDGVYVQQELSAVFNTGFLKHSTLIGAEYSKQHKDELVWSKARQITNIFNPQLENWAPLDTNVDADTNNTNTFENYGVYLQDLMTVTDQLKVLVGLRYDNLSQDRDDKTDWTFLGQSLPVWSLAYFLLLLLVCLWQLFRFYPISKFSKSK